MFRYIITPYKDLTKERPFAFVGWGVTLEFSVFDELISISFITKHAKTGPESNNYGNGQYRELLILASDNSDRFDNVICPNNNNTSTTESTNKD